LEEEVLMVEQLSETNFKVLSGDIQGIVQAEDKESGLRKT
jgi:hypothetical protein